LSLPHICRTLTARISGYATVSGVNFYPKRDDLLRRVGENPEIVESAVELVENAVKLIE